jgi:hypothetical protein
MAFVDLLSNEAVHKETADYARHTDAEFYSPANHFGLKAGNGLLAKGRIVDENWIYLRKIKAIKIRVDCIR